MRLPVAAVVALLLGRELLRALAFPLHLAWFRLRLGVWRKRAAAALAAPTPAGDAGNSVERLPCLQAPRGPRLQVFLSAGETSGEVHASNVLRALRRRGVDATWTAFGGAELERAGARVRYPLSGHAVMGLAGVLSSLPFILRAVACFLRMLRDDPPDLVVLVDYPGLHVVLGRLARRHGVPVVHYIAPQYWAWAPWRLRRYRRCVDSTLTILPFEPAFFESVGLPALYAGHPLLDHLAQHEPPPELVAELRTRPTLCMLPGSRTAELETNVRAFASLAARLREDHPDLRCVMPHIDPRRAARLRELVAEAGAQAWLEVHQGPLGPWLRGARVVLAKSGTGSLEACLHGTPTVIVYRVRNRLSLWLSRNILAVPWVGSANLIANREVVPEHVFADDRGWLRVEASVRALLVDGPAREGCLRGLGAVRERVGEPGASDRVAGWIAACLAGARRG